MNQAKEDEITLYRVRPRFQLETKYSIEELTYKIKEGLQRKNAPCKGMINDGYGTIYLPETEQHYWSPQLSLSIEQTDTGTNVRGLFGPRPAVWTMFIFFYFFIGFAVLIVLIIGMSYYTLGKSAAILWLVPVLILVFLSLFLVSYSGKKLGRDQMVTLHKFIEEIIGHSI